MHNLKMSNIKGTLHMGSRKYPSHDHKSMSLNSDDATAQLREQN